MGCYIVTISSMTATYEVGEEAPTKEKAIEQARGKAMADMKHWRYTATAKTYNQG